MLIRYIGTIRVPFKYAFYYVVVRAEFLLPCIDKYCVLVQQRVVYSRFKPYQRQQLKLQSIVSIVVDEKKIIVLL